MQRERFAQRATNELTATLDTRLLVIGASPLNAETRLALHRDVVTPNAAFYIRSHFSAPQIDRAAWRLNISGDIERPLTFSLDELLALPSRTLMVTLECAGNGRSAMCPQPPGEPWQYGAVSSAEWTGVPLQTVLAAAGLAPSVSHIIFEGADSDHVAEAGRTLTYARSLPRNHALHPDTLLAYAMNGEELSVEHGFPVRLIVPGWYGMASVKWLTALVASSSPFDGFYQVDRYVMLREDAGPSQGDPLTWMRLRSLIAEPAADSILSCGDYLVRGFAWSGDALVSRVEVSVNGGVTWEDAVLTSEPERYLWRSWEYRWRASSPGRVTLLSRAYDDAGNQQPTEPESNRLGYANNAIQAVHVVVR